MWYRGTSLIRKCLALGSYIRSMPRTLRKSGGGAFSYERGTPVGWGNGQGSNRLSHNVSLNDRSMWGLWKCNSPHKVRRLDQCLHVARDRGRQGGSRSETLINTKLPPYIEQHPEAGSAIMTTEGMIEQDLAVSETPCESKHRLQGYLAHGTMPSPRTLRPISRGLWWS